MILLPSKNYLFQGTFHRNPSVHARQEEQPITSPQAKAALLHPGESKTRRQRPICSVPHIQTVRVHDQAAILSFNVLHSNHLTTSVATLKAINALFSNEDVAASRSFEEIDIYDDVHFDEAVLEGSRYKNMPKTTG